MGVEYERWLIAKGNVLLPAAATVAKLIELLREQKWIVDPIPASLERLRFEGSRASFADDAWIASQQSLRSGTREDAPE